MKIIIYTIPVIDVSLESEQIVNPADIVALKSSVANLSTGYTNIQSWITQHMVNHPTTDSINSSISSALSSALTPINSSLSSLSADVNTLKNSTNPIICAGTCAVDGTTSAYGHLGLPFTYEHSEQDQMTITHNYGSTNYGVVLGSLRSYDEGIGIPNASLVPEAVYIKENYFAVEAPAFIDYQTAVLTFIMFRKV